MEEKITCSTCGTEHKIINTGDNLLDKIKNFLSVFKIANFIIELANGLISLFLMFNKLGIAF